MKIATLLALLASLNACHGLAAMPMPSSIDTNNLAFMSLYSRINALSMRNDSLTAQLTQVQNDINQLQTWLLLLLITLVGYVVFKCFSAAKRSGPDFKPSVPYAPGDKAKIGSDVVTITESGSCDKKS